MGNVNVRVPGFYSGFSYSVSFLSAIRTYAMFDANLQLDGRSLYSVQSQFLLLLLFFVSSHMWWWECSLWLEELLLPSAREVISGSHAQGSSDSNSSQEEIRSPVVLGHQDGEAARESEAQCGAEAAHEPALPSGTSIDSAPRDGASAATMHVSFASPCASDSHGTFAAHNILPALYEQTDDTGRATTAAAVLLPEESVKSCCMLLYFYYSELYCSRWLLFPLPCSCAEK